MPEDDHNFAHDWSASIWDWPLQPRDGSVRVTNTKDRFEVGLEMSSFSPKEIEVKVMGHDLVIHCQHDEVTNASGVVSREVNRIYKIPQDVDVRTLQSKMLPSGLLIVSANKIQTKQK